MDKRQKLADWCRGMMLMPCLHTVWLNHSPWTIRFVASTRMRSYMIQQGAEQLGGATGRIRGWSMSNAVRLSMFNTTTMERGYVWVDMG